MKNQIVFSYELHLFNNISLFCSNIMIGKKEEIGVVAKKDTIIYNHQQSFIEHIRE
jgi:hypothetical protein